MDTADSDLENKCENLMNIVVESRKRFGKMCVDYEQKTSLVENRMLNLQIETFSNYKFKPKHPVSAATTESSVSLEDFSLELLDRSKKIQDLRKKIKNTQEIVAQLNADNLGRRLREPLTADFLLAKAKDKKVS